MASSGFNPCRLIVGLVNKVSSTSQFLTFTRPVWALPTSSIHTTPAVGGYLQKVHESGIPTRKPRSQDKSPISGFNYRKGIVLKTVIRHPKKPNSGNRKCAIVKLSTGREICAYIPGEGHNLQEHSQVSVIGGRRRDLIGVKANIVRGKYDCAPVRSKKT